MSVYAFVADLLLSDNRYRGLNSVALVHSEQQRVRQQLRKCFSRALSQGDSHSRYCTLMQSTADHPSQSSFRPSQMLWGSICIDPISHGYQRVCAHLEALKLWNATSPTTPLLRESDCQPPRLAKGLFARLPVNMTSKDSSQAISLRTAQEGCMMLGSGSAPHGIAT